MKFIKSIYPNSNVLKHINNINYPDYIHFNTNMFSKYNLYNERTWGSTNKLNDIFNFKHSYNNLPIDIITNGYPTRLRRFAKYHLVVDNYKYDIYYNKCNKFKQDVIDCRKNWRNFESIEYKYINSELITNLIGQTSLLSIINSKKKVNSIDISVHQVRQICYPNIESHNSPEGIHKDGVDFIVSALVINKINIKGGKSIIYDKNKEKIYEKILNEGEGIFQEDKTLWHYVEPISSINNYIGYRDIIGIDLILNE